MSRVHSTKAVAFTGEGQLVRMAIGQEAEAARSRTWFASSRAELRLPFERISDPQISLTRYIIGRRSCHCSP
jgi:hypothetical protein